MPLVFCYTQVYVRFAHRIRLAYVSFLLVASVVQHIQYINFVQYIICLATSTFLFLDM
jgi:phosphoglycerol transferase MdoB-like AlkP superfamily enzyme